MNEPDPRQPTQDGHADGEALEALVAAALDALETDGPDAVERLLTAHPNEASRVRRALEDLRRMELLETPEPGMPEQLGDFTILEQLGAGGMGVVYRARQRSLDREVALKVVRPELLLFEGARERFRREIDAVARLDHASIVPILATGSAQGVPFYAMPLLHGRNGEELVEALAGRAPASLAGEDLRRALGPSLEEVDDEDAFAGSWWQTCVRLVRKAALGIHHAHTRGVLHRDLKPSNVLFTPTGNAVVIDFGLARAPADLQMTRTGTTAGSPVYMSPEQVRSEPCDERTDVYGLAATLHCLLSLAPPFSTGEPNALFDRILAGACTDLGRRDAAPVELRAVLACGMDIDRLHRYPSALAFADDLAAVLAGRPISARQLPAPVRLRRFVRRHPTGTAALGVAAASLVVLLAVLFWQQRAANRDIAAEVREKERINAALSESNRVLQEQIARADRSVSISIDAVEGLLSNVVRDRLRNLPGTLRMGAEMMHQALALFDRLPADAEHSPRVARARIQTLYHLIEIEDTLGDHAAAIQAAERALDHIAHLAPDAAVFEQHLLVGKIRRTMAGLVLEQGDAQRASVLAAAARRTLEASRDHPQLGADARRQLALLGPIDAELAVRRRDAAGAERALREAVALTATRDGGPTDVVPDTSRLNLAMLLKQLRRYDEALVELDHVLSRADDPDVPEVGWPVPRMVRAMALAERSRCLSYQKSPQAAAAARAAIAQLDDVLRDYPEASDALRLRGATYGNLSLLVPVDDPGAAVPLLDAALADLRSVVTRSPGDARASDFLLQQLRSMSKRLRDLSRWTELEAIARELGGRPDAGRHRETAARDLLRCAAHVTDEHATALREEALQLLLACHRDGATVLVDDSLYAPLCDDPRFAELRQR